MTNNQQAVMALPELEIIEMTQAEFEAADAVVQRGLLTCFEVGQSLREIRDKHGYRLAGYGTFENYCHQRLNMARRTAYQMIEAAEAFNDVRNCAHILPANEAQVRPLVSIPAEQRAEAWARAVETAPQGKVTARIVQAAVDEIKMPHVSHNSGNNEWYTPPEYIEAARSVLGAIDLDPASSVKANEIVKARRFYTTEDDGLTKRWRGKVWMNPPYAADLIGKFTSKLCEHVRSSDISEAIVLVNNATEAEWFEDMAALASTILFTFRRVKFLDDDLNPRGAPLQGQSLLYFGPNYKKFIAAFSNLAWAVNHGKH